MNTIDLCCFVVLLLMTVRGGWVGLVNEWAGLLGVFLGYFLSVIYAPNLDLWFQNAFEISSNYSLITARVFVFLVSYIFFKTLGSVLTKILKLVWLNWINRALGCVSGAFKAIVFMSVFFTIYNNNLVGFFDQSPLKGDSSIFKAIEMFGSMLFERLPEVNSLQAEKPINV